MSSHQHDTHAMHNEPHRGAQMESPNGMHKRMPGEMHKGMYWRFAVMVLLSFLAMYVFMYAMVNALENVFNNVNTVYMAGLMAAPMAVFELVLMWKMYPRKALNIALILVSVVAGVLFWFGVRQQVAVGDVQFIRSMIPHHAGALLMCDEAQLEDPELKQLCESIKASQQSEIDQMKRIYERLGARD